MTSALPLDLVTLTTPDDSTPEDGVRKYLDHHIWLPVLGTLLLFVVAVLVSFFTCKVRQRCIRRRHQGYSSLDGNQEDDWTLTSKVELQKRRVKVAQRDTALLNCSFFLRSSGEYTLLDHLPELGSRDSKQWFLVRHKDSCVEYVLTVFPKLSDMILPFSTATVKTISEFILTLQHPYIHPMREVAFQMDVEHIVSIYPYNRPGSLRDHIHSARCIDSCDVKYSDKGQPLELPTVRLYGKQILQALLFLKLQGFPFFGHLHSGNVMVVDNTCRLCGYENTLLSVPSKLQQLLRRFAKSDMKHFDVICFGHLLYEMLTGFELDTAIPESRHYVLINRPEVSEILQYIFSSQASAYPSIKKISQHEFFRHVKLKELDSYTTVQSIQPPPVKSMLKTIKKSSPVKKRPSVVIVGETQTRQRSESQASLTSKSSMGSSATSGSKARRSSQYLLPLTPVLSESERAHLTPEGELAPSTSHGGEKGSVLGAVPDVTTERTALLSEIQKGYTLKKTGSFSVTDPRV